MKRKTVILVCLLLVTSLVLMVSPVLAAKPLPVIQMSNGFPSGEHFNLNVHGKDPARFTPDLTVTGGNPVFVALDGDSTLTLKSDSKSALTELSALDPYAEAFDGDPALVQSPREEEGYYVFAKILAKPNNSSGGDASSVILTPNPVPRVSDYVTDDPGDLLALGLVTTSGAYELDSQDFLRFDPSSKGKGKSPAVDITGLFLWTGWVCDASLDLNGDGVIDINDVPADQDLDGDIDAADFDLWLAAMAELGLATYYENEWIFNIADIVEQDQTISNDGAKLLQIRFYPVDTTVFDHVAP
ncbi:MAG: hypothetical protein A2147_03435 [Chloroflexi bacterium RBG_16_57_8]|nr:MAG: hypothetical protein A2147_03435 [Chloroflexi bacterium RBG_16_57_8]